MLQKEAKIGLVSRGLFIFHSCVLILIVRWIADFFLTLSYNLTRQKHVVMYFYAISTRFWYYEEKD